MNPKTRIELFKRYCRSRVSNKFLAEDVSQEMYLEFLKGGSPEKYRLDWIFISALRTSTRYSRHFKQRMDALDYSSSSTLMEGEVVYLIDNIAAIPQPTEPDNENFQTADVIMKELRKLPRVKPVLNATPTANEFSNSDDW